MAELPTGTVTFLFTDVEGSTRLLHELGNAYTDVLGEHRKALCECFGRHGGMEVDTQGDAFFVAFAKASDALAAAADRRAALEPGPIRVRMGGRAHRGADRRGRGLRRDRRPPCRPDRCCRSWGSSGGCWLDMIGS